MQVLFCLFRICFMSDENRIFADALDVTPRDDRSVFGRKRGEKPVAGDDQCGYFARAGIYFKVADATEQAPVAKIDYLLVFQLRKAGNDGNQSSMHIKPPLPSLIMR